MRKKNKDFILYVPDYVAGEDIKKYVEDKNLWLRNYFYVFHPEKEVETKGKRESKSHYHVLLRLKKPVDMFVIDDLFSSCYVNVSKVNLQASMHYLTCCGKYELHVGFEN